MKFSQKKNIAFYLGIHLSIIRHFIGGNAIISQGALFMSKFDVALGTYTSIIINGVQFLFIIFGLLYISKSTGKRSQFLVSVAVLGVLNIALAIGMIFNNQLVVMILMCLFMAVYGAAFISPIWSYPSEIVPAAQSTIPNITHWLALAASTLIPPLVTGAIGNPYPVFIFFGLYSFIGFAHIFRHLKESDGYTYNQIIKRMN